MVVKTQNLKKNPFDEAQEQDKGKSVWDLAEEPTDYGMIAIKKDKLPGVWEYDRQLEQLFDQDIESLIPMEIKYDFGRIIGMTEKPDETKDRMKSSLFYSILLNKPPKVTFNLLDELNKIAFKKPIDVKKAMAEYSDYYLGRKKYTTAIKHGIKNLGVRLLQVPVGAAKMEAEIGGKIREFGYEKILKREKPDYLKKMDTTLEGWSDTMHAAIQEYYRENKQELVDILPGAGFVGTLREYWDRPELFVQSLVESSGIILEGLAGTMLGGPGGGIVAMGIPLSYETYPDIRAEGTKPLPALAQSMLTGVGEATIEQWTLSRKLGIMQNFNKFVAEGLPKMLWEGTKVYFRGTAEEGTQEFNRNFWQWVFTDRSQQWKDNVAESMAIGGPMELAMAGGFAAVGSAVGQAIPKEQQIERIDQIQEAVQTEPTLTEEHKAEIQKELDTVREDVESDVYKPPAEEAIPAPQQAVQPQKPAEAVEIPSKPAEAKAEGKYEKVIKKLETGEYKGKIQQADYANVGIRLFQNEKMAKDLGLSTYDFDRLLPIRLTEQEGWNLPTEPTIEEFKAAIPRIEKYNELKQKQFEANEKDDFESAVKFEAQAEKVIQAAQPVAKAEPAKPKTIQEMSDAELLEKRRAITVIDKKRRKPQQIIELQTIEDELVGRHQPGESDISQKTRNVQIKETSEAIRNEDLYRDAEQALGERYQALPLTKYSIARNKADIPGEVKDYIGKPGEKGYKGYLWNYLTTLEESPHAMGYDEALDMIGGRPGDIGEFIARLDEVVQKQKGVEGVVNQAALDEAVATGEPYIELLAMKYEMLKNGFAAQEINDTIKKWAQDNEVDAELIEKDFVPVEGKQDVRTKQQILQELEKESPKVTRRKAAPEETAIKKAHEVARKTKQPQYIYEKTGKDIGLFTVSNKPPIEGKYRKVAPPVKSQVVGEITEGYSGMTPEEKAGAKKLRQKIHAIAINKGLTKKALEDLKKKHTGYRKLTGKISKAKITTEQLQNLLKAVKKTRPKRIGYKKVVTLKTEKKIATLKESLQEKLQMTDEAYEDILNKTIGEGREPKYISAKRFITEKEGKEIIKRMNNEAEIIRVTEGFEKAIRENRGINAEVKRLDDLISKKKKRDPYTLESMRYYCRQCELKTGAPIFTMYMDLIDTHLETSKTRTATLKGLETVAGKDELRRISRDDAAKQRIVDYISSQSKLEKKPLQPKDITEAEKKIAKRIQEIFKDKEIEVRFTKFYWWYITGKQEGSFPMADFDRYKSEINKAVDIYESRGKDELIEYLKTQEWGVIKSGYEPIEHITNKIRLYVPKSTTVGKTHIQIRTDIEYHRQERDIFQRLSAYLRQIDMLYNLSPKINAFIQLFEDNMDKFDNPKVVQESIEIFLRNLKRYNIQGGFFERLIARVYSQAMRTIIMPSPILAYRNLFQNAAFEHDKSILINTHNKSLTPSEIAYLETYVQQIRGIVEEYFMVGEKPLPGLRTLTDLVEYVKLYPYSDVANRYWGFWAKINQVHRALEKESIKEMMKAARFDDMTELEQRRALGFLARDGKEAMAMYVARTHVDDIHFLYERSQRSPAEMTTLGRTAGNLMLFPRAYGEKLAHASNKVLKGKTSNEQWRGLKIIFSVIGGGMAVGSIFTFTTGRKRNPYDPLQILSYQPGGLALGAITQVGKVFGDTILALGGDEKAAYRLTSEIPRMADMFIPFYAYVVRGFEALTDQKNVDTRELRKIYAMIDKEYKIRGGAYKVRRNALEKWQYFLAGAGVDQKEAKKKAKPITR